MVAVDETGRSVPLRQNKVTWLTARGKTASDHESKNVWLFSSMQRPHTTRRRQWERCFRLKDGYGIITMSGGRGNLHAEARCRFLSTVWEAISLGFAPSDRTPFS